jgi:hypothetical protein
MGYHSVYNISKLKSSGVCLFSILIIGQVSKAQVNEEQDQQKWLLNAGIFFNKSNVIDKSFSSVPYSGNNPGASFSVKYHRNRTFHEVQAYYTAGELQAATQAKDKLTQTHVSADYTNLYRLGSTGGSSFIYKAGAGINVFYNQRDYSNCNNNNESFEFAASLSGVVEASYFFENTLEGFSISDRISLPLVSYIAQPVFGSEDTEGSSGKNSQVTSFSSFFRVLNLLSLEKKHSGRQRLSLCYTWDYYQSLRSREVKKANHQVGLTYSFIF